MARQSSRHTFSISSLHDLCFSKLIEEFDHYSPEMLSLLPPAERKELLLYCPVVSICHIEHTCAFNGIDSDMFWNELLWNQKKFNVNAVELLLCSYDCEHYCLSNCEKYFTFLTAMIFSGDRFSGYYVNRADIGQCYCTPRPEECSCPDDIVNYLVAYRKPNVIIEEVDSEERFSETDSSEEEDSFKSFSPVPIRDMLGQEYGNLYEEATKGQHVYSHYSHYILKENHYRLSDEDAVSLMMNECNYYPRKLFVHEYEHMHWKWSDDNLIQLLTQFFCKLESLSLRFRQGKEVDDCIYDDTTISESKKGLKLVLKCCFSSPVLSSLVIADPVTDDRMAFFQQSPAHL